MSNKTWADFIKDYVSQLKMLFRQVQGDKQPLMKKIVIYSICLLIGVFCVIGMIFNGYANNIPIFIISIVGLAIVMWRDIGRYRCGEVFMEKAEMGKRSPAWVRWIIAIFGIIVVIFALLVLLTMVIE